MRVKSSQLVRYINLFRHFSNPSKYLAAKFRLSSEDPLEFVLRNGLRVCVPRIRLHEFKMIYMDDCYLKGFKRNAFSHIREMVVVDVGANLGFFTLYAKSIFPDAKVYCIEPLQENYAFLLKNVSMNGQIKDSLTTLNVALWSESGSLTLSGSKNEKFPTGASVLSKKDEVIKYQVSALGFEDLFSRYGLAEISFLKLDCEGAEYDILYQCNQANLERVHSIVIEVHEGAGDRENAEALSSFLNKSGFFCCVSVDNNFIWASRDANKLVHDTS